MVAVTDTTWVVVLVLLGDAELKGLAVVLSVLGSPIMVVHITEEEARGFGWFIEVVVSCIFQSPSSSLSVVLPLVLVRVVVLAFELLLGLLLDLVVVVGLDLLVTSS